MTSRFSFVKKENRDLENDETWPYVERLIFVAGYARIVVVQCEIVVFGVLLRLLRVACCDNHRNRQNNKHKWNQSFFTPSRGTAPYGLNDTATTHDNASNQSILNFFCYVFCFVFVFSYELTIGSVLPGCALEHKKIWCFNENNKVWHDTRLRVVHRCHHHGIVRKPNK